MIASQEKVNRPDCSKYAGFSRTTTVEPSRSGPAESNVVAEIVAEAETSASLSRSVKKMVRPDRRLISIS